MINRVKGTYDILPNEISKWNYLETVIRRVFSSFGYSEIRTPIMENYDLIHRKNDSSDMVKKETYDFLDHSSRMITLRPENTAGIVRAYIENKLYVSNELRVYYIGPNFRYERPQKFRNRQFYQFGVELFNANSSLADVEILSLVNTILKELKIDAKLHINSIGDLETRTIFREEIKNYFSQYKEDLCPDCLNRLETNPLRILDCKVDNHKEFFKDSPKPLDYLNDASKANFNEIISILDKNNIDYIIDKNLVRGLDYYDELVFEIIADYDGSKLAVGGGGRYNHLVSSLDGPDTKCVGFACGMERVVALMPEVKEEVLDCYAIFLDYKYYDDELLSNLRNNGLKVLSNATILPLKKALTKAFNENPKYILIIGEDEYNNNSITIKENESKLQVTVKKDEIYKIIKEGIKK